MKSMNKKILFSSAAVIAVVILSVSFIVNSNNKLEPEKISLSYVQTNKDLKDSLSLQNISMSSPLKLSGTSIEQYCTFFSNDSLQNAIEYCTSTELLDSAGKYLGNIHMVGTTESPRFVIGVIQVSPTLDNLNDVKIVYKTMVESLVCTCWDQEKPGGFGSVSDWIDAANTHHLEAKKTTSRSEISGLAQKGLLLEITTNTEGYLWKFIVPN